MVLTIYTSFSWFGHYLSERLHTSGNRLKEGGIRLVAASNVLRGLNETSAEGLKALGGVLLQLISMGVQTHAEKRMALLDTGSKHIKELHLVVSVFSEKRLNWLARAMELR